MRRSVIALSAVAVTLIGSGWVVAGCTVASTQVLSYEVTDDIGKLNVQDSVGTVEITAGTGPVQVTETIRYTGDQPTTTHATDAGTLLLTNGCSGHAHLCQVDYRVRMPAATSLDITDPAGLIKVTGLAGDLTVTTEASNVEATGLTSAHTTVRDNAGHINLRYASAPALVDVTNQAGAIEVHVPVNEAYAVDATTQAGRTKVSVPQNPAATHRISAHNDAGAITIGT
jgi:DUF4097 and DUF4098 domain-containing protein YvlB